MAVVGVILLIILVAFLAALAGALWVLWAIVHLASVTIDEDDEEPFQKVLDLLEDAIEKYYRAKFGNDLDSVELVMDVTYNHGEDEDYEQV